MGQVITFEDYTPAPRYDTTPWTAAQIEEAESASGPWTQIDEVALDPVDSNPAVPATRNFTTENGTAPALWYRIVFVDATGDDSQPTAPVKNSKAGPPAQFATSDEFAARMGLTLTGAEVARADTLLTVASGLIRQATRQTISLVEDDIYTRRGTTDERILLPQRPVVTVASVELNGVALSENSWYIDGNELVRKSTTFVLNGLISEDFGLGFGCPSQTLTITYTHGYEEIPGLVHAITMEAVVRVWVNPGSVVQEHVGDTETTYAPYSEPPRGLLLTNAEEKALRRLFGRRALSITIGG